MNNKLFYIGYLLTTSFILFSLSACAKLGDFVGAKYINCETITGAYVMTNHNPNGVDYIVTCNIDVARGGKLIIEKGTTVQFMPSAGINVSLGTIEIRGQASGIVTLEPMANTPLASWKGITLGSNQFNEIFYANIKGAKTQTANSAVHIQKMALGKVQNCIIEDTGCGVYKSFPASATVRNNSYINVGQGFCEEF